MSDYLWDKTGEPEADVEQLENLLGTLKYKPRALEIPADAMPHATAAATRTPVFFSRARLAIAASLLLTLLTGMWFITRQGEPQKNQIATVNNGSETGTSEQPEKAIVTDDKIADSAPGDDKSNEVVAPEPRETRAGIVRKRSLKVQRAPRGLFASNTTGRWYSEQPSSLHQRDATRTVRSAFTHDHASSTSQQEDSLATNGGMRWESEQPLTPQQREATEQLMLALSVASAKFNYAQREMQEIGRAGNR